MEEKQIHSNHSGEHFCVSEICTSVDEFKIRQTTYKISLKLQSETGSLELNTVYTNNTTDNNLTPIYCTRRSANLPVSQPCKGSKINGQNEVPISFSFHFELERGRKKQKMEESSLFIKRNVIPTNKDYGLLTKHAVNVLCQCKNNGNLANTSMIRDFYPDCNKAKMIDFSQQHSCIELDKHVHDWQSHGLTQIYFITITEFDFSEATRIPYEAQRILAKRELVKQVKNTDRDFFEEIRKPFDVTIICKDGYEIDVHGYVLTTRNEVFRKMLSANTLISGRVTSFRKLAKDTFLGKRDRNKNKTSKTVTIDESEVPSGAMKVLLHFMYFGELHNDWKMELDGVLHGAHKYRIRQLLDYLDVLLVTLCKRKNALALLKLAEKYSLCGAKSNIRDYVFTNLGGVLQESVKITSV